MARGQVLLTLAEVPLRKCQIYQMCQQCGIADPRQGQLWGQGLGLGLTLPIAMVRYPAGLSAAAIVVSFAGSPPMASATNTPCSQPERMGRRPVIMAAREGEQRWKAEYQVWKTRPSLASCEMWGVRIVPLLPV